MQSPAVHSEHRGQGTRCPDARARSSVHSAAFLYAGSTQGDLGMEEPRHPDTLTDKKTSSVIREYSL